MWKGQPLSRHLVSLAARRPIWCQPQLCVLSPQAQLTDLLSEQRAKVLRLQAELETSEQVQRDFVRLSQALQVQCVPFPSGWHDPGGLF